MRPVPFQLSLSSTRAPWASARRNSASRPSLAAMRYADCWVSSLALTSAPRATSAFARAQSSFHAASPRAASPPASSAPDGEEDGYEHGDGDGDEDGAVYEGACGGRVGMIAEMEAGA